MRKVIALILGCLISVFICKYWSIMASHMDSRLAYALMVTGMKILESMNGFTKTISINIKSCNTYFNL